jgi:hypothetical protein
MRWALADAGDALDDANFETSTANAAILRITKELAWTEEVLAPDAGALFFASRRVLAGGHFPCAWRGVPHPLGISGGSVRVPCGADACCWARPARVRACVWAALAQVLEPVVAASDGCLPAHLRRPQPVRPAALATPFANPFLLSLRLLPGHAVSAGIA